MLLKRGGCDCLADMQWQTIEEANVRSNGITNPASVTARFQCFCPVYSLLLLIGIVAGSKIVLEQALVRQRVGVTPDLLPRHVSQFRKLETQAAHLKA